MSAASRPAVAIGKSSQRDGDASVAVSAIEETRHETAHQITGCWVWSVSEIARMVVRQQEKLHISGIRGMVQKPSP